MGSETGMVLQSIFSTLCIFNIPPNPIEIIHTSLQYSSISAQGRSLLGYPSPSESSPHTVPLPAYMGDLHYTQRHIIMQIT